jgi:hypothetical protein
VSVVSTISSIQSFNQYGRTDNSGVVNENHVVVHFFNFLYFSLVKARKCFNGCR